MMMLVAGSCRCVLRIGGPSAGADEMVARSRAGGRAVFASVAEVPAA
ncbi:hypothetical protein ACQP2P_17305 [Dactylosporangium sp. CA-139114]